MSNTPPDPTPSEGSSDWLTRARHIFFGTAATFVEMIEDPEKREENWSKMSMDINELAQELAAKGQITEEEALRQIQEQQRQQQSQQDQQHPQSQQQEQQDRPASDRTSEPRSTSQSHSHSEPRSTSQSWSSGSGSKATPQEPAPPTGDPPRSQTSTPPPDPEPTAQPKSEPVSADDISALMDLTREVERLRRDLEERRNSHSDSDRKSSS